MDIRDFSTEELRAELKRRLSEERSARAKGRTYKAQYAYATATITRVTDEPYCRKNYFGIVNNDSDCGPMNERWLRESLLFIEQAKFTKNSAPKPGDVVRVKSRRTKYNPNGFGNSFSTPYITEIITPSQN